MVKYTSRIFTPLRNYLTNSLNIPGLRFLPHFVDGETHKKFLNESLEIHKRITKEASSKEKIKTQTYLARQHNQHAENYISLIQLKDEGRSIEAQHFENYGENGHNLTYFTGNQNIPMFIQHGLIKIIEQLEEVKRLKMSNSMRHSSMPNDKAVLTWKFSLNIYRSRESDPSIVPGFPFHIDTPSNGEITTICTLASEAILELRKKDEPSLCHALSLTPCSLLLLSGESRWNWEHRVIPKVIHKPKAIIETDVGAVSRISLVLGCG